MFDSSRRNVSLQLQANLFFFFSGTREGLFERRLTLNHV